MGFGNFGPGCCCSICANPTSAVADDFSGGSLDTNKFYHSSGTAPTVTGGQLVFGATGSLYVHAVNPAGITGPDDAKVFLSDMPTSMFFQVDIAALSGTLSGLSVGISSRLISPASSLVFTYFRSGGTFFRWISGTPDASGHSPPSAPLYNETSGTDFTTPYTIRIEVDFLSANTPIQANIQWRFYLNGVLQTTATTKRWAHQSLGDVCELWATIAATISSGSITFDNYSFGPL